LKSIECSYSGADCAAQTITRSHGTDPSLCDAGAGNSGEPRLLVSTFELDAPDRRYTVDTVAHFQATFDDSTELFFIMGADSWSEITTWRDWERLLTMTNHIVVARPGYDIAAGENSSLLRDRIIDLRTLGNDAHRIVRQVSGESIHYRCRHE